MANVIAAGGGGAGTITQPTTVQTPNGPKTMGQIQTELRAANWDGRGDPVSVYNRTAAAAQTGGGGGGGGGTPPPAGGGGGDQLARGIQDLLRAIASGNQQAFNEAVRQFNLAFGLDRDKFTEDVRRFNVQLPMAEAQITGQYQGQPTLAGQQQQFAQQQALANLYGQAYGTFGQVPTGAQTLAAQQQAYAQQLGAIQTAAGLQANPFRQQQVLGQLGRVLGGQGVAGFQAPNVVQGVGTAGGNQQGGLGYMSQLIEDIRNPTANTASMNSILEAIPTPNKVNSVEFLRSAPSTQNLVLQGMQERYGLDPNDALRQIQNTLPQFRAPTTFGQVQR